MTDSQSICDKVMQSLMEAGNFKESDFFKEIRGYGLSPHERIELCKATFREYLKVGEIKRCIGGYCQTPQE